MALTAARPAPILGVARGGVGVVLGGEPLQRRIALPLIRDAPAELKEVAQREVGASLIAERAAALKAPAARHRPSL